MSRLSDRIAADLGIKKTLTADVLTATVEAIHAELAATGTCRVPGLGTFRLVERAARTGRNPATGAPVAIPAKQVVRFRPSTPSAAD